MRGPLLVLTWVVATVAATGLAWAGVRTVVTDVAAPLPAPTLVTTAGQASTPAGQPSAGPATPRPDPQTPVPAQATTRAFQLVGGTATVRFAPERVTVLSAVPASGFDTDVGSNDDRTRVEFESDRHRSRLEVWWADGARHQVEEHSQGGGGDDDDRGGSNSGPD